MTGLRSSRPARSDRLWPLWPLALLTAAGFFLRFYRTDTPFHSGDFATMPYMVGHWSGHSWILSHSYGPLLPGMVLAFARGVVGLGLGMTETLWRLPLVVVGTLHVPVTYLLMRRLGGWRWSSILAAGIAAVAPSLTNDARYPWGYESLGAAVATFALWAWLRDLQRPTRMGGWLAGMAVAAYLLSHLMVYALPVVLVATAFVSLGPRGGLRRLVRPSLLIPVGAAAAMTCTAYLKYDGGIIGRMVRHAGTGTVNIGSSSWWDVGLIWCEHLGPPWMTLCTVGVLVGLVLMVRGDRRGLPALWTVVYIAPPLLLLNVLHMGRPDTYQIQASYAASLAGCLFLQWLADRTADWIPTLRAIARGGLATTGLATVALLLLGSVSNLFTSHRFPALTGSAEYGRARSDPGYKAAGWYVRTHVPVGAVIYAAHGTMGLEYPCATYYTGRHVAAAEDTSLGEQYRIIAAIHESIDVAIIEPAFVSLFRDVYGFEMPVRIGGPGRSALFIAARRGVVIPEMQVDVAEANEAYDRLYALRRVPVVIERNERTATVNRLIHRTRAAANERRTALAAAEPQ